MEKEIKEKIGKIMGLVFDINSKGRNKFFVCFCGETEDFSINIKNDCAKGNKQFWNCFLDFQDCNLKLDEMIKKLEEMKG